ncbi:MAG: hypothetical protein V5B40_05470 [Candidatus Accumulibacter meliphilus]|jgi:hypothetical protein|uniref:hypothetical protein n=1 Tax=Candidatus Accumulibacter meliphilus TaxID=2211374 RepID=UPI002FC32B53
MRLSRVILRLVISLALAIAILWAGAALWIDGPESRVLAGALVGAIVLIAGLAAVLLPPWSKAVLAIFAPV